MPTGRTVRTTMVLAVASLVLAGCTWSQARFDAAQTGFNPRSLITPDNVGTLKQVFTVPSGRGGALVRDGKVYTGAQTGTQVIESLGNTNCTGASPNKTCAPLWTYGGSPVLLRGSTLFARAPSGPGEIAAYDADGADNCGGSPKTCAPLWWSDIPVVDLGGVTATSDYLYVYAGDCSVETGCDVPLGKVFVFDVHGVQGCSGSPKVCTPLWTYDTARLTAEVGEAPTVADGKLYVRIFNLPSEVLIFDAAGNTNCSGSPKVCTPIGEVQSAPSGWGPLPVVAGRLYGTVSNGSPTQPGPLGAFDANGGNAPLWTSAQSVSGRVAPAVAHGRVFTVGQVGTDFFLYAYDAAGTTGCSGSPRTCAPLWSGSIASINTTVDLGTVVVAGDVVYVTLFAGAVKAFDARGITGCSGAPKVCTPLWSLPAGVGSVGGATVVGNSVFVPGPDAASALVALRLP